MKERVTLYFHDTAMVSYLREQRPGDPTYTIPHGEYHFDPSIPIDDRFNSVMLSNFNAEQIVLHGKPSTMIIHSEDSGIIQLTSFEYDSLTRKGTDRIAELEAEVKSLAAEKYVVEDQLIQLENDVKYEVADAYQRGIDDANFDNNP